MPEETARDAQQMEECVCGLNFRLALTQASALYQAKEGGGVVGVRGVLLAPGRYFFVQNPLPKHERIATRRWTEQQIARGVATLADLLRGRDAQIGSAGSPEIAERKSRVGGCGGEEK